jgi:6-pyruvoyl tetrahydropterin synthase/QueD family protein
MGGLVYEVTVKQSFSAAHMLKEVGGTCEKLHGHNFIVEVSVYSGALTDAGILIDFRILKQWTDDILKEFDHKYLITEKVKEINLGVSRVTVWESENARVSYYENGYARYSKPER